MADNNEENNRATRSGTNQGVGNNAANTNTISQEDLDAETKRRAAALLRMSQPSDHIRAMAGDSGNSLSESDFAAEDDIIRSRVTKAASTVTAVNGNHHVYDDEETKRRAAALLRMSGGDGSESILNCSLSEQELATTEDMMKTSSRNHNSSFAAVTEEAAAAAAEGEGEGQIRQKAGEQAVDSRRRRPQTTKAPAESAPGAYACAPRGNRNNDNVVVNVDRIAPSVPKPQAPESVPAVGIPMEQGNPVPSFENSTAESDTDTDVDVEQGAAVVDDGETPTAQPVLDDSDSSNLQIATEVDPSQKSSKRSFAWSLGIPIFVGVVVVIIVVTLLQVFLPKNNQTIVVVTNGTTGSPEEEAGSQSVAPAWGGDFILSILPESSRESIFQEGGTPQRRAYGWMLGDPLVESYSKARLLQRFALATFYYATNGENWNTGGWLFDSTKGWMEYDTHECDWAFTNDSNVVETHNGTEWYLMKDIPCELVKTEDSEVEDLVYDRFWFRDAGLTGSLPPEVFLLLTNLKTLIVRGNQLTGTLSPLIGELSQLEALDVSFNKLGGTIPEEILKCSNLQGLLVEGVESESIENKIGGTIPTWLFQLQELKHLEIGEAAFTGTIPTEIGLLTNLRGFYAQMNQLTGTIPTELGLTALWELNVFCKGCDSSVGLTGTLPTELGLLTNMYFFSVAYNKLTGTLPTELGLLPMWTFGSGTNGFSGTMPTELGLWSDLHIFSLWHCENITGTIPSEIGLLTDAIVFDLQNTAVSGTIPTEVGLMTSMEELFWAETKLTGTLPTELGQLTNMWIMSLENNALTGNMPSEIGLLTGMEELYLHNNLLTGSIPQEVADPPLLLVFNAANNDLTGSLPVFDMVASGNFTNPEVGDWMSVYDRAINLTGNALTGTIPSSMCVIDSDAYSLLHYDCSLLLCGCSCSCDTGMATALAANMTYGDDAGMPSANMTNTTAGLRRRRH